MTNPKILQSKMSKYDAILLKGSIIFFVSCLIALLDSEYIRASLILLNSVFIFFFIGKDYKSYKYSISLFIVVLVNFMFDMLY